MVGMGERGTWWKGEGEGEGDKNVCTKKDCKFRWREGGGGVAMLRGNNKQDTM